MLRRPGSSWGFGALLKGLTSVMVLKVEESAVHPLPPTDNNYLLLCKNYCIFVERKLFCSILFKQIISELILVSNVNNITLIVA